LLKAFLDIETTYLGDKTGQAMFQDYGNHKITVLGILLVWGHERDKVNWYQLVNDSKDHLPITADNLEYALDQVEVIVTYNGRSRPGGQYNDVGFDGPVIKAQLGVPLDKWKEKDLMVSCHARNIFGGQKATERALGAKFRLLPEKDGAWAMEMWGEYIKTGNLAYRDLVLIYNREDIWGLKEIEAALEDD
jgi:uncharacterized protein YprB with RNaseH-like and TPR domain